MLTNPLQELLDELVVLPGIGPKSAERLAFFLLTLPIERINKFCETISNTYSKIKYCQNCYNISTENICSVCADTNRLSRILCIVAEPKDIFAIEKTAYRCKYHVLGGLISPIDGIHPEILRIKELINRIKNEQVQEVILAINSSIEGETTILYLTDLLADFKINISRLAHGLPMGADIDYIDEITLKKAFDGRTKIKN